MTATPSPAVRRGLSRAGRGGVRSVGSVGAGLRSYRLGRCPRDSGALSDRAASRRCGVGWAPGPGGSADSGALNGSAGPATCRAGRPGGHVPSGRTGCRCSVGRPGPRRPAGDADAVAEYDVPAHRGERVERAVRAGGQLSGDIGVCGDVRVVAEPQPVREHCRGLGDVTSLTDPGVAADGPLHLPLRGALFFGRLVGEEPGAVVEVPYGRLRRMIHTSTLSSARPAGEGVPCATRPAPQW